MSKQREAKLHPYILISQQHGFKTMAAILVNQVTTMVATHYSRKTKLAVSRNQGGEERVGDVRRKKNVAFRLPHPN